MTAATTANTISFPLAPLSLFSDIKGSIELTIIFFGFWVVGHVSLTSNRGGRPFHLPFPEYTPDFDFLRDI